MSKRNHSLFSRILLTALILCLLSLAWIATTQGLASAFLPDAMTDGTAAVVEADKALETARQNAASIGDAKTKISEVNKGQKADDGTGKTMVDLAKYLKENITTILKNQKDSIDALTPLKQSVETKRKAVEALAAPKPAGADELVVQLKKRETDLATQIQASADASAALDAEAKKVYATVEAMAKDLSSRVAPLSDEKVPLDAKAAALLAALPPNMPILATAIRLKKDLDTNWTPLDTELRKIPAAPFVPPAGTAAALVKAQADIDKVHGKFAKWLDTLKEKAELTNGSLVTQREELDKDLQGNAVAAIKLLDEAEKEQGLLADFSAAWAPLALQLKDASDFGTLKPLFEKIDKALDLRPDRTQIVREALAGDFSKFVPDFVQLYYFTDAYNLIKALNPNVKEFKDVSALREEATRQRGLLDQASLAQVSAQQAVNDLQVRVRNLEEELRDAQSSVLSSGKELLRATRHVEELKARPNQDAGKIKRAEQRQADVETEDKANQDRLTKANDDKAGLPKQIEDARKALVDAQKLVRDRRIAMISLVQTESDAFAKARDNEPVYYTEINVTSKDPVKQVQIYAFGSRKVIYLRGTRENVDKIKDIISLFDRPAPQARLNLWTIELNGTPGNDGAKKFNKALGKIEDKLSNTRARIAASLSYLRDCINEEVNGIAMQKLHELEAARASNGDDVNEKQQYLVPQDAEDLRWARMYFYQKEVLMRLGFDPEKTIYESRRQSRIVNFNSIPDPAGTTTLGEALIVLSLANAGSRFEIMKKFSDGVEGKLEELGLCETCQEESCKEKSYERKWFTSTKRALGADDQPYYKYQQVTDAQLRRGGRPAAQQFFPPEYAYTSMQKDIVDAITMARVPRLIRRLRQLRQLIATETNVDDLANLNQEANTILRWLILSLGVSEDEVLKNTPARDKADKATFSIRQADAFAKIAQRQNVLRTASAKVARTDLMLRQIINAVDEDIDRHFVQPMMLCLRNSLVKDGGISVGIVNRTSVLATNRLLARVDARSSAQLTVGEEQDVLAGVQQLASLYLSAQTGGLLGGLNALGGVPQKQTSEVYGINSGSLFKVTPIFDPTGQALRFQFDYISANVVTDPDGSINPQLPRIERHTVNTEVELNNLELREISRFNSNSRLGIATTTKGGIPIIKDIPGMKYVPLLGWFVRRSGKSAVIQESLMFGQTTMYPTIADLFDLLSGEDYNFEDQPCPPSVVTPQEEQAGEKNPPEQKPEPDPQGTAPDPVQAAKCAELQKQIAEIRAEIAELRTKRPRRRRDRRQIVQRIKELTAKLVELEKTPCETRPVKRPVPKPPPTPTPAPSPTPKPSPKPSPSPNPGLQATPNPSPSPSPSPKPKRKGGP